MDPKHSGKHGKHKKGKRKNMRESSSSESQESEESDEWVEKPTTNVPNPINKDVERDSWMEITTSSTYSKSDFRSKSRLKKEEDTVRRLGLDKPGQHARELNPYWKDGGSGLPTASASGSGSSSGVGDGGLQWLQKAYQRAVEQAREEQRPLEDVVADRWGSLEKLERMIDEASRKVQKESRDSPRDEKRFTNYDRRRSGSPTRHRHSRDERSRTETKSRGAFMAPKDETSAYDTYHDRRSADSTRSTVPRWKKKIITQEKPPLHVPNLDDLPVHSKAIEPSTSTSEPPRSSSVSDDDVAEAEQIVALTDKEMNELGAKIVKAEIFGNTDLANQLKAKLEAAKKCREGNVEMSRSSRGVHSSKAKEVVLMLTDNKGLTRPLQRPEGGTSEASTRRSKKQKISTHDKEGNRERYFADDDKYSLKQMFEREKLGTAEDQDAMFARLAGRGVGKTSEEYDMDDVLTTRANRVVSDSKIEEGERLRAITEFKKTSAALERCRFCFEGKENPKHLIVAVGMKVYLRVPENQSLTEGQCQIVPMQHVLGATYLDEDVLAEIKIFRKGLTAMFKDRDLDVVYFENCMHLRRHPHMVLHCVPLPKDTGCLAPMYFKKAILESETEWAHNKKLVELKQKDIQKSVPKGLPYFSVEFGLDGGFAHVIEDEELFPQNFAQEIIGGMLDLDPNAWRRPHRQQFEEQRKKVLQLSEWWQPYDWTKRLRDSD